MFNLDETLSELKKLEKQAKALRKIVRKQKLQKLIIRRFFKNLTMSN